MIFISHSRADQTIAADVEESPARDMGVIWLVFSGRSNLSHEPAA